MALYKNHFLVPNIARRNPLTRIRRNPSTRTAQKWQFEVEDIVYEALYDPVRLGFWETKAYCDDLGGGWQLPTPTNYAEVSCRGFCQLNR